MRYPILCCIALAACGQANISLGPDLGSVDCAPIPDVPPTWPATTGEQGVLRFSWDSFVGQTLDRPLATGSHVHLSASPVSPAGATMIHQISDNFDVASTAEQTPNGTVTVFGHKAGTARILAYDDNNTLLDAVTITVADVDDLAFAGPWHGDLGPEVVVGTTERMRIQLFHGTTELVGWGATTFAFDSPIESSWESLAPIELLPGTEEVFFVATLDGPGTITATAGSATTRQRVNAVSIHAIGHIDFVVKPGSDCHRRKVTATLRNGTEPVFGPACTWLVPNETVRMTEGSVDGWADTGGWPGDHPDKQYAFYAAEPGVHAMQCVLPGGLTVPLTIEVE